MDLHSKVDEALYRIKIELLEMEVGPIAWVGRRGRVMLLYVRWSECPLCISNQLKEKEIQLQDTDDDATTESDSSSESDDEYVAVIG